jgi:hypothetical protein
LLAAEAAAPEDLVVFAALAKCLGEGTILAEGVFDKSDGARGKASIAENDSREVVRNGLSCAPGAVMEDRSMTAMPSPVPVMATRTLSLPSATSES